MLDGDEPRASVVDGVNIEKVKDYFSSINWTEAVVWGLLTFSSCALLIPSFSIYFVQGSYAEKTT